MKITLCSARDLLHLLVTGIMLAASATTTGYCFADDAWQEVQDVTFKGDIQFSKPLTGRFNHGSFDYDEGQEDVTVTTTGNLFDKNGTVVKNFTDLAGLLIQGEAYDYFQFDIDQWRVQVYSTMVNFEEKIIKKVFIRSDN